MSKTLQLLFPGCSSHSMEAGIVGNGKSFSLASVHFLTSLVVAIIIGISTTLAAHFLARGAIEWTAVAGGGAAVVSGLVTYVILRCAFGKNEGKDKTAVRTENSVRSLNVQSNDKKSLQLIDSTRAGHESNPASVTHSNRVHRSDKNVDVKGTVYILSTHSGPIRHDHRFEFAKRLRTENLEPIQINEDDFYLELSGEFETGLFKEEFRFLDKNGSPTPYLPSTLFEGVKEGESIRFFYDNKLIELTCRQANHPFQPGASYPFERFLNHVKATIQYAHTQFLWREDIEGEPKFMETLIGPTLVQLDTSGNVKTPIRDFQIFDDDQKMYGAYQELQVLAYTDNIVLFNIHRDYKFDISSIMLIESKGFNGLHQIWILIPHKPKKNRLPNNTQEVTCYYGDRQQTFYRDSFSPQKGDRMAFYHYGQYYMRALHESQQIGLSFDESGWLKLTLKEPLPA